MIKDASILIMICFCLISCREHEKEENTDIEVDSTLIKSEKKSKGNQVDVIETIYYQRDSYKIQPKDTIRLNNMAALWRENGFLKVFGYTDTIGPEEHNNTICEKRTIEIFNYLKLRSGKNDNDAYVESLGEFGEVYDLHFSQAHPKQNCVDIWLIRN